MGGLFLAWLAEVGIITWRDVTGKVPNHSINGLPLPADYLASFLIFGALGFVPKDNPAASRTAALIGWGYVVATYLNVAPKIVNPTNTKGVTPTTSTPPTATPSAIITS